MKSILNDLRFRIKGWWRTKRKAKLVVQFGPGIKIYQFYPYEDKNKTKLVENDIYYSLRFYGQPIGFVQEISFNFSIGESHKRLVKARYEDVFYNRRMDPKILKRMSRLRKYCVEYGIELVELTPNADALREDAKENQRVGGA